MLSCPKFGFCYCFNIPVIPRAALRYTHRPPPRPPITTKTKTPDLYEWQEPRPVVPMQGCLWCHAGIKNHALEINGGSPAAIVSPHLPFQNMFLCCIVRKIKSLEESGIYVSENTIFLRKRH